MNVAHEPAAGRFTIDLDPYQAVLMYARRGEVMDLYHIYVPDPYRSRGLAGRLLVTAFEFARDNGLKVTATCPFIAGDFLPRFPQYHDLVVDGSFPFA